MVWASGHQGSDDSFSLALVEDGIAISLAADTRDTLAKRLANGDNFSLVSRADNRALDVLWIEVHDK